MSRSTQRSGTYLAGRSESSYISHYMFVRFRSSSRRLQVSLVETRRIDGKVRHEHVASFGSVIEPQTLGRAHHVLAAAA